MVLMDAILNANPAAPSHVNLALPAAFDSVVARALEKDRECRYQNATDLCSDLKRIKGVSGQAAIAATPGVGIKARSARRWRIAIAAGITAVVIAGVAFFYPRRTPALTEKDTIVLADFDNKTGDPVFDGALRQGMAVQLGQSPFLSLISDERTEKILRMMGQPTDGRLTPEIAGKFVSEPQAPPCSTARLQPRQSVRAGNTCKELSHRRPHRRGTNTGGEKRRRPESS